MGNGGGWHQHQQPPQHQGQAHGWPAAGSATPGPAAPSQPAAAMQQQPGLGADAAYTTGWGPAAAGPEPPAVQPVATQAWTDATPIPPATAAASAASPFFDGGGDDGTSFFEALGGPPEPGGALQGGQAEAVTPALAAAPAGGAVPAAPAPWPQPVWEAPPVAAAAAAFGGPPLTTVSSVGPVGASAPAGFAPGLPQQASAYTIPAAGPFGSYGGDDGSSFFDQAGEEGEEATEPRAAVPSPPHAPALNAQQPALWTQLQPQSQPPPPAAAPTATYGAPHPDANGTAAPPPAPAAGAEQHPYPHRSDPAPPLPSSTAHQPLAPESSWAAAAGGLVSPAPGTQGAFGAFPAAGMPFGAGGDDGTSFFDGPEEEDGPAEVARGGSGWTGPGRVCGWQGQHARACSAAAGCSSALCRHVCASWPRGQWVPAHGWACLACAGAKSAAPWPRLAATRACGHACVCARACLLVRSVCRLTWGGAGGVSLGLPVPVHVP